MQLTKASKIHFRNSASFSIFFSHILSISLLHHDRVAVSDVDLNDKDPVDVPGDLAVEPDERAGGLVDLGLRAEDLPAPQGVVEGDDPAGLEEPEDELVVGVVAGLVGVDEGEVECALLAALVQEVLKKTVDFCDICRFRGRS